MLIGLYKLPLLPLIVLFNYSVYGPAPFLIATPATQTGVPSMSSRSDNGDISSEDRAILKALDIAVYPTTGAEAMRDWERLRKAGGGVPIIVDPSNDFFGNLRLSGVETHKKAYQQTIDKARHLTSPADQVRDYVKRLTQYWEEDKARLNGPDSELNLRDYDEEKNEVIDITPEEARARLKASIAEGPMPEGKWPEDRAPDDTDWFASSGNAQDRFIILVAPVQTAHEALAYLDWGAPDDSETAQTVATLMNWETRYGVELVGLANDYLILKPERPPQTRKDALQLALEVAAISTIEEPNRSKTAFDLMYGKTWFLWWD